MWSTQNNLENPLSVSDIDINEKDDFDIRYLTAEEYRKMNTHNPNTLYYITDTGICYVGDIIRANPLLYIGVPRCYISYDPNTRDFLVFKTLDKNGKNLTEVISKWKDPQNALNEMMRVIHTSDKSPATLRVHEILVNYIKNMYGIETALLNILAVTEKDGHNGHAVQHMTLLLGSMGLYAKRKDGRDLNDMVYTMLNYYIKSNQDNLVVKHFLGLYGIFQKYDLFRGRKYTKDPESLDLSTEVAEIISYHVSMFPEIE